MYPWFLNSICAVLTIVFVMCSNLFADTSQPNVKVDEDVTHVYYVPGWGTDRENHNEQLAILKKKFPKAITINPYNWRSNVSWENAKKNADDAAKTLVKHLDITKCPYDKTVLVGHSLGGRVVLKALELMSARGQEKKLRQAIVLGAAISSEDTCIDKAVNATIKPVVSIYHSQDGVLRFFYQPYEGTTPLGLVPKKGSSPSLRQAEVLPTSKVYRMASLEKGLFMNIDVSDIDSIALNKDDFTYFNLWLEKNREVLNSDNALSVSQLPPILTYEVYRKASQEDNNSPTGSVVTAIIVSEEKEPHPSDTKHSDLLAILEKYKRYENIDAPEGGLFAQGAQNTWGAQGAVIKPNKTKVLSLFSDEIKCVNIRFPYISNHWSYHYLSFLLVFDLN